MAKAQTFRDQTVEELALELTRLKAAIFAARSAGRGAEKSHVVRGHRRDIARILSVVNERNKSVEA